jgi:hypothetical protein
VPPATPEPLRSVLVRLLADDPADRYTAAEVAARLGGTPTPLATVVASVVTTAPPEDPGPPTEAVALPQRPRGRGARALVAAAGLAVAGTLSLLTTAADRHDPPPASPTTGADVPAQNGVGGTAGPGQTTGPVRRAPAPATHANPPVDDHDKGKDKKKKGKDG